MSRSRSYRTRSSSSRDRKHGKYPLKRDSSPQEGTNLFVVNLTGSTTEDEIYKLYSKYGKVKKCRLIKDPDTGYNVKEIALPRNTALLPLRIKMKLTTHSKKLMGWSSMARNSVLRNPTGQQLLDLRND